jgi:hypothetical protein
MNIARACTEEDKILPGFDPVQLFLGDLKVRVLQFVTNYMN